MHIARALSHAALSLAHAADLLKEISLLKRNALAAPFQVAFAAQQAGQTTELMSIHYRDEEYIFVQAQRDRVTAIFSTVFKEEADQIFGRVFLQVGPWLPYAALWHEHVLVCRSARLPPPSPAQPGPSHRSLWMPEDSPPSKMLRKSCTGGCGGGAAHLSSLAWNAKA
jgi:hypothetical protein